MASVKRSVVIPLGTTQLHTTLSLIMMVPGSHDIGDVLLHTVTDAILGALCLPDIGQLFSDTDPRWKGASSDIFLNEAVGHFGVRYRNDCL